MDHDDAEVVPGLQDQVASRGVANDAGPRQNFRQQDDLYAGFRPARLEAMRGMSLVMAAPRSAAGGRSRGINCVRGIGWGKVGNAAAVFSTTARTLPRCGPNCIGHQAAASSYSALTGSSE